MALLQALRGATIERAITPGADDEIGALDVGKRKTAVEPIIFTEKRGVWK